MYDSAKKLLGLGPPGQGLEASRPELLILQASRLVPPAHGFQARALKPRLSGQGLQARFYWPGLPGQHLEGRAQCLFRGP